MQSIRVTGEIWVEGEPNVSWSYSEYKEKGKLSGECNPNSPMTGGVWGKQEERRKGKVRSCMFEGKKHT